MHLRDVTLLQLGVILVCPCSSPEGLRRRAQALTWVENLTLLYRALLPVPVWYNYFEGSGMGMVLCAMTTGLPYLPLYSGPCCTLTSHFILQATACVICTPVKVICLLPICYCQRSTLYTANAQPWASTLFLHAVCGRHAVSCWFQVCICF